MTNAVLSRVLYTVHQQISTELNGAEKGVGDSPCCHEAHSLWSGMLKSNQHKYEAECGIYLKGTNAYGEICAHLRKQSKTSGKGKH